MYQELLNPFFLKLPSNKLILIGKDKQFLSNVKKKPEWGTTILDQLNFKIA